MRLAELSERTGVSVATLKYYLREGLLHPGATVSRTQADYGDSHVERVRLVRALSEVGGLSLATVGRVLEVITTPGQDWMIVLETAQRSLVAGRSTAERDAGPDDAASGSRALAWLQSRRWHVDPQDPFIDDLDRAWLACEHAGIGLDEERMDRYAEQVVGIAEIDVASVPADPEGAVRQVILGTILVDPVLSALRRLAQQHVSMSSTQKP